MPEQISLPTSGQSRCNRGEVNTHRRAHRTDFPPHPPSRKPRRFAIVFKILTPHGETRARSFCENYRFTRMKRRNQRYNRRFPPETSRKSWLGFFFFPPKFRLVRSVNVSVSLRDTRSTRNTQPRTLFRAVSVPCGQQGSWQYLCRR